MDTKYKLMIIWQRAAVEFEMLGSWSMAEYCRQQLLIIAKGSSVIVLLLFLSGCAGGASAGGGSTGGTAGSSGSCVHDVARSWVITSIGETINLSQNCTGYTVLCGMQFTYTKPTATGQSTVNVISTNGNSGCTPPGTYSCTMNLYGYSHGKYSLMGLNCGTGEVVYDAD